MTHDFLNDLQVGFVLAEASAECVPQDMAAKLWQKNRVTIFLPSPWILLPYYSLAQIERIVRLMALGR